MSLGFLLKILSTITWKILNEKERTNKNLVGGKG